jgi:hypothetical protein
MLLAVAASVPSLRHGVIGAPPGWLGGGPPSTGGRTGREAGLPPGSGISSRRAGAASGINPERPPCTARAAVSSGRRAHRTWGGPRRPERGVAPPRIYSARGCPWVGGLVARVALAGRAVPASRQGAPAKQALLACLSLQVANLQLQPPPVPRQTVR